MRMSKRDSQTIWYSNYTEDTPVIDEYGNETGKRVSYTEPEHMLAVVSPAAGSAGTQEFGNLDNYDKTLWFVAGKNGCPFNEDSILFVDKEPEHNTDGDLMPDYRVRRVAEKKYRSKTSVLVAIEKVKVS